MYEILTQFAACDSHVIIIFNLFLKISVVLTSFHGQRRTVLLANTQLTMIFFGNDHHRTYIAQYSHSEKSTNCLSFLSRQGRFFFPFFHCLTTIEISGSLFVFFASYCKTKRKTNQSSFINCVGRKKETEREEIKKPADFLQIALILWIIMNLKSFTI